MNPVAHPAPALGIPVGLRPSNRSHGGARWIAALAVAWAGVVITVCGSEGTARLDARGRPTRDDFFPIAVWLQNPANATRYRDAGINLYVGLWRGPTAAQLTELARAGMPVICTQNEVALTQRDNPIILGWMHDDEPDNAQPLGGDRGYGPPIPPARIVEDYRRMRAADPTRPILLNLGQGVAWDDYIGRGVRRNRPEDYPEYIQGCDIASFDIYPVVHPSPEIAGRLEFVARGVERLVGWSRGLQTVWNCIECTHISNPTAKATPAQVKSQVWMSLIRGSRGLIYFVHQFKPSFREAALLEDPEMLSAVSSINRQLHELAPILNSPTLTDQVTVTPDPPDAPEKSLIIMTKIHRGRTFVFAMNLAPRPARGHFQFRSGHSASGMTVLGENRRLSVDRGSFTDDFEVYGVHLYASEPGNARTDSR